MSANTGRRAASDLLSKSLSPIVIDVTASGLEAHGARATHAGEAYLLVLDGQIEFHSHLYAPLPLRAGGRRRLRRHRGICPHRADLAARVLVAAAGETAFTA